MKPLALIPARAGSKRLPGKHLLDLGGKPLIAWTIEAAKASGVFDTIVVSSDGDDILRCAQDYGAVTHRRSENLATDHLTLREILPEICHQLSVQGSVYVLVPTVPFRRAESIRAAWRTFQPELVARTLLSIRLASDPPEWILRRSGWEQRFLVPADPGGITQPRTTCRPAYRADGGHWIVREAVRLGLAWDPWTLAFISERPAEQLEVDTPEDLRYARWLLTQPDAA